MEDNIREFQEIIGYSFNNEQLIVNALTHSSYANEHGLSKTGTNERLEFLGDAVLELIVSEHIFRTRTMPEGEMTKLRASVVCEESLSFYARKICLGKYLLLGKGERTTGGAQRSSLLADAFEAVLGAIFLDGGLDNARKYVLGILGDDLKGKEDYKTDLQEIVQKDSKEPLIYAVISESGPDHNKVFVSGVSHMGKQIGSGQGRTKKESEQMAAKMAIETLRQAQSL